MPNAYRRQQPVKNAVNALKYTANLIKETITLSTFFAYFDIVKHLHQYHAEQHMLCPIYPYTNRGNMRSRGDV